MIPRRRELLALLSALGGSATNLDFQKLLLFYCQEVSPQFEFVPYRFGAFSFTSYADRRKLVEAGLLEDDERAWRLTPEGKRSCSASQPVTAFVQRHPLRGDDLVAESYRRYPYYAARSEIAARVLAGDETALNRIDAARPAKAESGLTTIGYEGRTLESYLNALLESGVSVLCDVRRNPLSRKYGFSKRTLASACAGINVRYEHLPDLGIESDRRRNLSTPEDYEALFDDYRRSDLATPRAKAALKHIAGWLQEGHNVALTCFERQPTSCHRHCVAEALQRQMGAIARNL